MTKVEMDLLQTMDAQIWAKEFKRICDEKGYQCDEEWMQTWFANAIMAGYDEANRRNQSKSASPSEPGDDPQPVGTPAEIAADALGTYEAWKPSEPRHCSAHPCYMDDCDDCLTAEPRRNSVDEQIVKLKHKPDSEIDTSDIPEVTDWSKAIVGKFYREPRRDEREEFEAWVIKRINAIWEPCQFLDGRYVITAVQEMWEAWASRASAAPLPQTADKYRALMDIAGRILEECQDGEWGGIEWDGADCEELLTKAGLIEQKDVTEACGENCVCEGYGFPGKCNRTTALGADAIKGASLPQPSAGQTEGK